MVGCGNTAWPLKDEQPITINSKNKKNKTQMNLLPPVTISPSHTTASVISRGQRSQPPLGQIVPHDGLSWQTEENS